MARVGEPHPESFEAVVERECAAQNTTQEVVKSAVVGLAAKRGLKRAGTSLRMFSGHASGEYDSPPSPELMRLTAEVLDIPPEAFGSYRLWQARQALDESIVTLDVALDRLAKIPDDALTPRDPASIAAVEARRKPGPNGPSHP